MELSWIRGFCKSSYNGRKKVGHGPSVHVSVDRRGVPDRFRLGNKVSKIEYSMLKHRCRDRLN